MGWTDDFHLDINTQQNYWLCEVGNLSERHAPLATMVERLRLSGGQTAEEMYGAEGWVAHVVTNAWVFGVLRHGHAAGGSVAADAGAAMCSKPSIVIKRHSRSSRGNPV
jgi:alpha-L-fucosidase 2